MDDLIKPERTEELGSGATVDWYADQRIVAYTLNVADEGVMQAWTKKVNELLQNWDADQPYLALHDLSAPGCAVFYMVYADYRILNAGVSPDNRENAEKLLNKLNKRGKVAIHLSMSLSGRVTQHSAELTSEDASPPPVEYKTFFNRDAALEWLMEDLD